MRETVWHILLILIVTGVVFFSNLGTARLWDRDEPRNAGCAAEMMERGDWVVPIFNDELRHQKPVLLYWLIMSAYSVFGVNEFSARFWSAALAVGTTFATYAIARRLFNSTVALYASIALATSLMFDVAARAATPDSVLTFFVTTSLMVYILGTFQRNDRGLKLRHDGKWFPQNRFVVAAMYALMGMAVLAKGPVGFLLPMAMIGMFLLIYRLPEYVNTSLTRQSLRSRFVSGLKTFHPIHFAKTVWSMHPFMAATIILAIAGPWFFLVDGRTEGDFTRLFFVGEHFGRATTALENHSGGIWFYPVAILVGFFPWSVFWGPVLVDIITQRSSVQTRMQQHGVNEQRGDDQSILAPHVATTFLLCWVGVQVGLFSLAQTKLPSYVTPCYPALGILTSACLVNWTMGVGRINYKWFVVAFAGLIISGLAISLGVGFATHKFLPSQFWLTSIGLAPLLVGIALIWMTVNQRRKHIPILFSAAAVMFCVTLFGFGTVSLDNEQQSNKILETLGPEDQVATFGCLESSWVYYARRPVVELLTDQPPEPATDFDDSQEQRKFWKPKSRVSPESFVNANKHAVIITTADQLDSIKKRLPGDFKVTQTADYFLKNKQLILLRRTGVSSVHATATNPENDSTRIRLFARQFKLVSKWSGWCD